MLVWQWAGRIERSAVRLAGLAGVALLAVGCASPGPPKAPSLQLPEMVTKLEATRHAGAVELEFAVPARTSDGLAYRGATVRARVCRAVEAGACVPVDSLKSVSLPVPVVVAGSSDGGAETETKLVDVLPESLLAGPARLLTYRVELSNEKGKTAGFGDAVYAAAGAAPEAVPGLRAEGSRRGVAVRWQPAGGAGEVVLRRELVGGAGASNGSSGSAAGTAATAPAVGARTGAGTGAGAGKRKDQGGRSGRAKPAKGSKSEEKEQPGVVWLSTVPEADPLAAARVTPLAAGRPGNSANGVLDESAEVGSTYRYAAERRETVQFGGHSVVLHGELSAPVMVTLQAVYPPPAPMDLVGTVFPLPDGGGLAVDLIWTPADDPGTVGYKVWREADGVRTVLTKDLVKMPAFHDVLPAGLAGSLRYGVVAVDGRGMESVAAVTVVVPHS